MQLVDRIEKRRFVGREFVLWLWFESELFDATLSTKEHGEFGFWIEKEILLSSGKETTRIKGGTPAQAREAKEALQLGKMPERASFHLSLGEREAGFALKAEPLSLSGLKLPTVLGENEGRAAPGELGAVAPSRPKRRRTTVEQDAEAASDKDSEAFFERMALTREVEVLLEALYRDFLALRLSDAWDVFVVPAIRSWAAGKKVDEARYRAARAKALPAKKRLRAARVRGQVAATGSGHAHAPALAPASTLAPRVHARPRPRARYRARPRVCSPHPLSAPALRAPAVAPRAGSPRSRIPEASERDS